MKLLLTNDDGIDAPGLAALERVAAELGAVTVVAPRDPYSGCGHQTTTDRPLRVIKTHEACYALDGTPADCTRIGLLHLAAEAEWVLSGINSGGNLGVDVFMSGTVAAVREAALLGRPGIALSQYRKEGGPFDWDRAATMARAAIERLITRPPAKGAFWNVNLPDLRGTGPDTPAEIVFCELETGHVPVRFEVIDESYHYRGDYHNRPGLPGGDVHACFAGNVTVTEVHLHRPV